MASCRKMHHGQIFFYQKKLWKARKVLQKHYGKKKKKKKKKKKMKGVEHRWAQTSAHSDLNYVTVHMEEIGRTPKKNTKPCW